MLGARIISIYIPALWKKKKAEVGDCGDKLSKTGDTMLGPLEMGGNKITGLSAEYPPQDDSAPRWDQITKYTEEKPLYLYNESGAQEVAIDHTGINVGSGKNLRVNIPEARPGPEIDIQQRSPNFGGIRITEATGVKSYQLGFSQNQRFSLWSLDLSDPGVRLREVCSFAGDRITRIGIPRNDDDVANKLYVDYKYEHTSRKHVICVWAASNGSIVLGTREWCFGERVRQGVQSGFPIPANGRVIRGGLSIKYQFGITPYDPTADVVALEVNGQDKPYFINTGINIFVDPLEINQGDILTFKSIVNIPQAKAATVSVLIELDL